MRMPGLKWAIEQPRVHSSCHQAVSTKSTGDAAFGPSRAVSASSTRWRRSAAGRPSNFSATWLNVNDPSTP